MEAGLTHFTKRLEQPWLTCQSTQQRLADTFRHLADTLQHLPPQMVFVIAAEDSTTTLAAVLAALATGRPAVLGNPQWVQQDVQIVRDLLGGAQLWLTAETDIHKPVTILGRAVPDAHGLYLRPVRSHRTPPLPADQLRGALLMQTGGTGGAIKLAWHNWQTLSAAIDGYARFWGSTTLNSVCALPVFHISGLMPALRSFATGGRLCLLPWKELLALAEGGCSTAQPESCASADPETEVEAVQPNSALPDLGGIAHHWQISLVPTQVQRLLGLPAAVQWLRSMQAVLIGGSGSSPALLEQAAQACIPLCPTYGMTETAATIAVQRPEDFLREHNCHTTAGATAPKARDTAAAAALRSTSPHPNQQMPTAPAGEVLPHLTAEVEAQSGRIILSGKSLFCGYFPQKTDPTTPYATGDHGQLCGSHPQRLRVLGRLDRIVISGGKKIDPARVEHAITVQAKALGLNLGGVLVTGVADADWGERLVAFIALPCPQKTDAPDRQTPHATPPPAEQHDTLQRDTAGMIDALRQSLHAQLEPHQRPKQWIAVNALPLNERGKPDRALIAKLANR